MTTTQICPECGELFNNLSAHVGTNPCEARKITKSLKARGMVCLPMTATEKRAETLAPYGGLYVTDTWYPGGPSRAGHWTSHLWLHQGRLAEAAAALKWACLRQLADEAIASNPSTPPEVLTELATDDRWQVRKAVATNPSTPPEVLIQLASDKDWDVREAAAGNPATPLDLDPRKEKGEKR